MITERLQQQMEFIREIEKLKQIHRRNPIGDGSRKENDAEHSWHLAMMVLLLAEYSAENFDRLRALQMVLIHDLVEIDAGDTFAYDARGMEDQHEREVRAAVRIFNLLPPDQARQLRNLWDEFEARQTPESRFASAVDRLHPMLNNYNNQGGSWKEHGISIQQTRTRNRHMQEGAPALWEYAETLFQDALKRGWLQDEDAE